MNILKVILALGFALFLVQFPGNISFSWLGMEIETSMAVFFHSAATHSFVLISPSLPSAPSQTFENVLATSKT